MSERLADLAGTRPNPYPDELKAFNKALAEAQGEFPAIAKTQTADAGSYTYTYVDLAKIFSVVLPILSKHGLSVLQPLESLNGVASIRTIVRHRDGEAIASSWPLGELPQNQQQRGSIISYNRRYALMSFLGIAAAEEDDDANSVASAPTSSPPGAEASPFQPPEPRQEPLVEDLTSAQRKKIFAIRTKLLDANVFTDEQWTARLLNDYEVDSVSGLTKSQASELIERLVTAEAKLDEGG
jgi:hypothetical protein